MRNNLVLRPELVHAGAVSHVIIRFMSLSSHTLEVVRFLIPFFFFHLASCFRAFLPLKIRKLSIFSFPFQTKFINGWLISIELGANTLLLLKSPFFHCRAYSFSYSQGTHISTEPVLLGNLTST